MSNNKKLDEVEWDGTSAKTIQRIMEKGILTIEHLLQYTTKELAEKIGAGESTVDKVLVQAVQLYGTQYITGEQALENVETEWCLSTGSAEFDRILYGGLRSRGVTEVIGQYSGGKTQLCFTVAVLGTQIPVEEDEGEPYVVFIDNEYTFEPQRVAQIATERGYDPQYVLSHILIKKANTSDHQAILINMLDYLLKDYNVKLVIVDGMISHLRSEYLGRGSLSERQQKLNKMLHKLQSIGISHNIPVLLTNQVQADPSSSYGDPNKPAGGHIMAHANKFRVRLWNGSSNTKLAMVIDSSFIEEEKTRIAVTKAGIVDEKGDYPSYILGEKRRLVELEEVLEDE